MSNGTIAGIPGGPEAYRQASIAATLDALFENTVSYVRDRIDWYIRNSRNRARISKNLRISALVLFSIGTIAPILVTFLVRLNASYPDSACLKALANFPWVEVGFVFLALAGAIIVFDQFFGVSASWLRFVQAQVRLESMLGEFRYSWFGLMAQSGGVLGVTVSAQDFIKLAHEFVTKVELLAQEETKEWADQYRAALDKFDQNPDLKIKLGGKKSEEGAPGDSKPDPKDATAAGGSGSQTAAATEQKPGTVTVRLAVDLTDLDEGSLVVTLNDQPLPEMDDGFAEVPLEINTPHRFAGRALKAGKIVKGELAFTPQPEDDNKPLQLELS